MCRVCASPYDTIRADGFHPEAVLSPPVQKRPSACTRCATALDNIRITTHNSSRCPLSTVERATRQRTQARSAAEVASEKKEEAEALIGCAMKGSAASKPPMIRPSLPAVELGGFAAVGE